MDMARWILNRFLPDNRPTVVDTNDRQPVQQYKIEARSGQSENSMREGKQYQSGSVTQGRRVKQQTVDIQDKLRQAEAEIATLSLELESLRQKLDEEQRHKQQQETEMGDALKRAETQLMTARDDVAALRLFKEEENIDAVRTLFNDVATGIDDLVFGVFEKLSEAEVSSPVIIDQKVFDATGADITNTLWPFLVSLMVTQPTLETVAMPAMHCIASSIIYTRFLQPFHPMSTDFNGDDRYKVLVRLWNNVAERESQEVMGRWRSIAFRAICHPQAEDDSFLENMAVDLLASLRDVIITLLPQELAASRDWEQLFNSLMPRTVKLLRKAIGFQTVIQGTCVSWNYIVYHPASNGTFVGETMEVDAEILEDHAVVCERRPVNGSRVLLATSLGLQAHRKSMHSEEFSVIQKAKVVVLGATLS
ncbi:hypothetical protein BKA62DRAFT_676260 [Auriculariales sp. MPI-PUGE-AT-0066]|nr:hypothetical protein BKA62DRAFT_676260 [Auriculariales sp. MPI-PUGE-AT-0066]